MPTIRIEGSEFDLDDTVCKTDKSLREALTPFYPSAANADIKRETKGDNAIITVTKRAGSKGAYASVVKCLDSSDESIHPALLMDGPGWRKAKASDLDEIIAESVVAGRELDEAAHHLELAPSQPAGDTPVGF